MGTHQNEAKPIYRLSDEAMRHRISEMKRYRDEYLKEIEEKGIEYLLGKMHLMEGNDKTGESYWTISFIPVIDCPRCEKCMYDCYDLRNVCYSPDTQKSRALNSAIHLVDPEAYWKKVGELLSRKKKHKDLRINVGGDLRDDDFYYINEYVAKVNPNSESILFFTKNDEGINKFLDEYGFNENVDSMMSRWPGMPCDNRHHLPEAHVLFKDGTTTAPEFGAVYCGGNCTECKLKKEGCPSLENGEHLILLAH